MTFMTVELYRAEVLGRLAEADQEAAAWQALADECRELATLTGVGGAWDGVNAKLAGLADAAARRLAFLEEYAASLLELLPQLDAIGQ
jgi:hypothetical protein